MKNSCSRDSLVVGRFVDSGVAIDASSVQRVAREDLVGWGSRIIEKRASASQRVHEGAR